MTTEVDAIYKRPPNPPREFQANYLSSIKGLDEMAVQQADLLFLPNDKGFRYALVVVDIATRRVAAEALKSKTGAAVLEALKHIYASKDWKPPLQLQVDGGGEFAGPVLTWLKDNNVNIRVARPDRHTQQRLVENANKELAKMIFHRQTAEELLTDQVSREWVDDLPDYVDELNASWIRQPQPEPAEYEPPAKPSKQEAEVLAVGTPVRILLDRPEAIVSGEKRPARAPTKTGFRATDPRYSIKVYKLGVPVFKPEQSIRYYVQGINNTTYARHQLQVVPPGGNTAPDGNKVVRNPEKKTFIPVKIHGRRKRGNRVEYLVEWKGYPAKKDYAYTWRLDLMRAKGGREMIDAFEAVQKANDHK